MSQNNKKHNTQHNRVRSKLTHIFSYTDIRIMNYEINSSKSYSCYTLIRSLSSLVAKDLEMLIKYAERLLRGKASTQCHRSAQRDANAYRP
jgi:hypothetical protein